MTNKHLFTIKRIPIAGKKFAIKTRTFKLTNFVKLEITNISKLKIM